MKVDANVSAPVVTDTELGFDAGHWALSSPRRDMGVEGHGSGTDRICGKCLQSGSVTPGACRVLGNAGYYITENRQPAVEIMIRAEVAVTGVQSFPA